MSSTGKALSPVRLVAQGLKTLCEAAILSYRTWISPCFGEQCRFLPSCSEYANEAIKRHGVARGIVKAARRLLRCHPFSGAGDDPVSNES